MSDTHLWEDLLLAIEERQVVPIVGDQLLTVDTPAGPVLFHHLVAQRLAAELGVDPSRLPPRFVPNDVVCAYEGFHGDPEDISPRVVRIVRNLKLAPPEPLRLLAEIESFELFISTSFDTLLEEAIFAARREQPAIVAFPPANSVWDFDEQLLVRYGAMVFQIFGRASASASFAVTEGQMLEHMHLLMEGPGRPENLIAKLQKSHLLILGVSLPDWLSRFLLRLSREKPLWDSRTKTEVIVGAAREQEFATFLQHFSPKRTRIVNVDSPAEFVRELHRRWQERRPAPAGVAVATDEKPASMTQGSIFVSYASEDRDAAFRLADTLSAAGLEVWIDRRLNPGDQYRNIIDRHIRECSAFIPVISQHTQTDDERWFRREWAAACERASKYFATDRSLLFPVVIDQTPYPEIEKLEQDIFQRHVVRAPDGNVPRDLIARLDAAQKNWRKQTART